MAQALKVGDKIVLQPSGNTGVIERYLGSGGQGEVYRVRVGSRQMALKWYYLSYLPHDPGLNHRLNRLIQRGSPDSRFLWPEELATILNHRSFGYIMRLKEARFRSLSDLLDRRVDPTFRVLATIGMNLADAFNQVHKHGMSYRDISQGNCSFDPGNGDIVIMDCDNVDVNGQPAVIAGTPYFMAPELIRDLFVGITKPPQAREKSRVIPNTETDLHSLAVLLFLFFMRDHPLFGRRYTDSAVEDNILLANLLGYHPLFLFDPSDDSNRPDPQERPSTSLCWDLLPGFVRKLFIQTFTEGLSRPGRRVREPEWRRVMCLLRDTIVICPGCGRENFCDITKAASVREEIGPCWNCRHQVLAPLRLRFADNTVVMIHKETRLYPHHLTGQDYDFSAPLAEVVRNPVAPNAWGLKNLGREKWVITHPDGSAVDVEAGETMKIVKGRKIHFGKTEGELF